MVEREQIITFHTAAIEKHLRWPRTACDGNAVAFRPASHNDCA
jgi:hypothetical protein